MFFVPIGESRALLSPSSPILAILMAPSYLVQMSRLVTALQKGRDVFTNEYINNPAPCPNTYDSYIILLASLEDRLKVLKQALRIQPAPWTNTYTGNTQNKKLEAAITLFQNSPTNNTATQKHKFPIHGRWPRVEVLDFKG